MIVKNYFSKLTVTLHSQILLIHKFFSSVQVVVKKNFTVKFILTGKNFSHDKSRQLKQQNTIVPLRQRSVKNVNGRT